MRPEVEYVSVDLNHDTGEGWMYVHPDASTDQVRAALKVVDDAGFEELDSFETGDEPEEDEHGRYKIPVVRIGGW